MCICLKNRERGTEEGVREGGRERAGEGEREGGRKILNSSYSIAQFMYYHIQYIYSTTNCHAYIVLHYVHYVKTEDLIITDQLDF